MDKFNVVTGTRCHARCLDVPVALVGMARGPFIGLQQPAFSDARARIMLEHL